MHDHLRHRLLGWWVGLMCDYPRTVLAVALIAAGLSLWITVERLHFQPDRNALISPALDWNQRYLQYRRNFSFDDLIVVIEVPKGYEGQLHTRAYADELGQRLQKASEFVRLVYWRIDTLTASAAAVRILPWEKFDQAMLQMADSTVVLRAKNLGDVLATIPAQLSQSGPKLTPEQAAERINQVRQMVEAAAAAIDGRSDQQVRLHFDQSAGGRYQYLTSTDGELLFMLVEPALASSELEPVKPAVDATRRIMDELHQQFPAIDAGLTGLPVIESDETDVTTRDSTISSLLAIVLIAAIMIASFHSVKMPMLILAALLIAVAWNYGFLTLAIGHLQLLSATFTVMILGLGVAFGIYIVSRFELVRADYPDGPPGFKLAMIEAMQRMGPGITTGAVAIAVSFATTLLTDFTGMAEMGLIAGVGILLCVVSSFSVLPALMRLVKPNIEHVKPVEERGLFYLYDQRWWMPFYRRPGVTVAVVVVMALVSVYGARGLRYDYNLSNLLPRGIESVQWFERIAAAQQKGQQEIAAGQRDPDQFDQSIWFGASAVESHDFPDPLAEARRRTREFNQQPTVAGVGGIGLLFPPDEQRKLQRIAEIRAKLGDDLKPDQPLQPSDPVLFNGQLQALGLAVQIATLTPEVRAEPIIADALSTLARRIGEVASQLTQLDPDQARQRLAVLNEQFGQWREDVRRRIDDALVQRPLNLSDLPGPAKRQAVGGPDDNVLLLQVYPRGNMYDPAQLEPFVAQLLDVDKDVTGTVVQIYESTKLIVQSYIRAGIYAFIAVFLLVLLDFRKPIEAFLSLMPVGMAFIMLLGLMGANDMPLNPANIIVLPLLFGIGVDCGIHMVYRYRQEPDEHPPGLAGGTGRGITLTTLTAIIGFACMIVARHRGIASLGLTLALGMALTLLVCLTAVPSTLEIRSNRRLKRLPHQNGTVLQK